MFRIIGVTTKMKVKKKHNQQRFLNWLWLGCIGGTTNKIVYLGRDLQYY